MSLTDAKPMESWGSTDPGPARMAWLTIDYPYHVGCLPGFWNMVVVNAETGDEMLVPGMHGDDPAVERDCRRWA